MEPVRKPRTSKMTKKLDTLFPISLLKFGSEDDPCFGKHFKPNAIECLDCGDCELCQIATAQNNHKLRLTQEKKGKFKDIEEREIYEPQPKKKPKKPVLVNSVGEVEDVPEDLDKKIRRFIRTKGPMTVDNLVERLLRLHPDVEEDFLEKRILRLAKKTKKFTLKNNKLKWNSPS